LIFILTLPTLNPHMTTAVIKAVHVQEGAQLPTGGKFLDVSVDLTSYAEHDCPAISYFRIAVRERAWVRRVTIAAGDEIVPGTALAHLSTDPAEALDDVPSRAARVSVAGILYQPEWW
jgi:pyruvate/2-oxoglutarate dehydrogenase complex dihydrolipoamide acyltransferase (E2) component